MIWIGHVYQCSVASAIRNQVFFVELVLEHDITVPPIPVKHKRCFVRIWYLSLFLE